jgi:hypothetical protein
VHRTLRIHTLPLPEQAAESDDAAQVCADNSVAALLKFLDHRVEETRAGGVDLNQVMQTVLGALPLCADAVEAVVVHGWLVRQLQPGGMLAGKLDAATVGRLAVAILGACEPWVGGSVGGRAVG